MSSFVPILRITAISAGIGVAVGLAFFAAFFFVAGSVGGATGSAPLFAQAYLFVLDGTAKVLDIPHGGSLFMVSYCWGIAAAAFTFVILVIKRERAMGRRGTVRATQSSR